MNALLEAGTTLLGYSALLIPGLLLLGCASGWPDRTATHCCASWC